MLTLWNCAVNEIYPFIWFYFIWYLYLENKWWSVLNSPLNCNITPETYSLTQSVKPEDLPVKLETAVQNQYSTRRNSGDDPFTSWLALKSAMLYSSIPHISNWKVGKKMQVSELLWFSNNGHFIISPFKIQKTTSQDWHSKCFELKHWKCQSKNNGFADLTYL